jgi:hypothetical protein
MGAGIEVYPHGQKLNEAYGVWNSRNTNSTLKVKAIYLCLNFLSL